MCIYQFVFNWMEMNKKNHEYNQKAYGRGLTALRAYRRRLGAGLPLGGPYDELM